MIKKRKILLALLVSIPVSVMHGMEPHYSPFNETRKNHICQMIDASKRNDETQFQNLLCNAVQNEHADVLEPVIFLVPDETVQLFQQNLLLLRSCAMAVYAGNKEIMDQAKIKYLKNPADKDSITVLHLTARHNHPLSIAELLLTQNPNLLNAQDGKGATPLLYAAFVNNVPMCKYLLSFSNINPNIKNMLDWTPLTLAQEKGHEEIVKLLQSHSSIDLS